MAWQDDPLLVCSTTRLCKKCGGGWPKRKKCQECYSTGFQLHDVAGTWAPRPAFLVCGGPSLKELPFDRLRDRGVVSLAINNAGAYAPVTAHTMSDEQSKFHDAMYCDPKMMSWIPFGKLHKELQIKHGGRFIPTRITPSDCPNVIGFSRAGDFEPEKFLLTTYSQWGCDKKHSEERNTYRRLCTTLTGIRILHYLGCPRIYLLGVDHSANDRGVKEPGYAWGDPASCGNSIWWKIDRYFEQIRPVCEAAGLAIYNCNQKSYCEAFDYVPFDEALADCKGLVEDEPLDLHDWYNKDRSKKEREEFGNPLTEEEVFSLRFNDRMKKCNPSVTSAS